MVSGFLGAFFLALVIIVASHLTVDKDFSPNVKKGTWLFLIGYIFLYIVIGLF